MLDHYTTSVINHVVQYTVVDSCPDTRVRLEGSTVPYAGRLEVCFNGLWGSVCDDLFDQTDADVVCRELGYGAALAPSTYYGPGSGPVWLDNLRCTGTEGTILNCSHSGVGIHNCGHSEDVGIICQRKHQIKESHMHVHVYLSTHSKCNEQCYTSMWDTLYPTGR